MAPMVIFGTLVVYLILGAITHRILVMCDGPQPEDDFVLSLLMWPLLAGWGLCAGAVFVLKRIGGVK